MKAKGFDKLLKLIPEDEVTRVFSDGVTPDNVNYVFHINRNRWYQDTLLSLATSSNWNKPDDLERIRYLLTMGAEVTPKLLAEITNQKQLRVILDFGVDPIQLRLAIADLYYRNTLITFIRRVKNFIMYGGVPNLDFDFDRADTKTKICALVEKVKQRVINCRRALLTLILCIQQKYKPLKWLIRRLAMQIWALHPFCSDLVTPSAGPRSDVWDWKAKNMSSNQALFKKQKQ